MKKMKQMKEMIKSLIINGISLGIFLLFFFLYRTYLSFDCHDYLKEKIVPLSACGLVSQKYYDKNHFNSRSLFYLEDNEELYFPTSISYAKHFWNAIEVGDSIFKEAGSDTVIVKHHKNNSYVIYKLECRFGKKYRNKD